MSSSSSSPSLTRHLHNLLHFSRQFSSSSSSLSQVYGHKLKFQKPSTIRYTNQPLNSASFIGTITNPLTQCKTKDGSLGVYTKLRVIDSSSHCRDYIYVNLKMWLEMAEMAVEHLKVDDFVYVAGRLRSYANAGENSVQRVYHDLNVTDINFVTPIDHDKASNISSKVELSDEDRKDKYRTKLHLWQVFFSNPIEWRDLRKCKKNPKQPDFKHKDTGESLWLSFNDPPWIQRQLQLIDSRMGGLNFDRNRNSRTTLSDFGEYI